MIVIARVGDARHMSRDNMEKQNMDTEEQRNSRNLNRIQSHTLMHTADRRLKDHVNQGLVNVLIEHHPNIGDIISNRYLKVMFKIPQMGHLPNPVN